MSPDDHNDRIRPEEERALDALIASQTDTSIDEKTADRLLSFLDAGESGQDPTPAPPVSAPSLPQRPRSPRRMHIAASVAVALATGAAALLLIYSGPDIHQDQGTQPKILDAPRSSYVASESLPREAAPAGAPRRATLALRVSGWAKKPDPPEASGDPVLEAWSGTWVSGLDTEDLLREARLACAAVMPWPAAHLARRSRARMPTPLADPASGLLTESLAAMPGVMPVQARRQRALRGADWLLQRVESGALSRTEILEPARLLLASDGDYRAELVKCFRRYRIRVDRMLPMRGKTVPAEVAGLCGALGIPRGSRILARAYSRVQVEAVVQSLRTGDETSLEFCVDLLLRAHRLTPQLDERRLAPFDQIEDRVWRVLLHVLQERASTSSSLLERDFLAALRERMPSKS